MSATSDEINDFLATVEATTSNKGNSITKIISINGRAENEELLTKFKLINIYADIIIDYFSQDDYSENNFFTTDEIWDVIQEFNDLCGTDYNIDL